MNIKELIKELDDLDESRRIEAKTASEVGKALMETVTAFANEPGMGGGYLVLGGLAKRGPYSRMSIPSPGSRTLTK